MYSQCVYNDCPSRHQDLSKVGYKDRVNVQRPTFILNTVILTVARGLLVDGDSVHLRGRGCEWLALLNFSIEWHAYIARRPQHLKLLPQLLALALPIHHKEPTQQKLIKSAEANRPSDTFRPLVPDALKPVQDVLRALLLHDGAAFLRDGRVGVLRAAPPLLGRRRGWRVEQDRVRGRPRHRRHSVSRSGSATASVIGFITRVPRRRRDGGEPVVFDVVHGFAFSCYHAVVRRVKERWWYERKNGWGHSGARVKNANRDLPHL